MNAKEILAVARGGETPAIEFKESVKDADEIKGSITAFSNDWQHAGGGALLIGIRKDGKVVGIPGDLDKVQQKVANYGCDGSIDPKLMVTVDAVTVGEKVVLEVQVLAGQRPPYRWNGRAYVRVGTVTRFATVEEENTLLQGSLASIPDFLAGKIPAREEIALDFVGRANELESQWKWLMSQDTRRCALVGQGGCGKTALAYEFCSSVRVRAPEPLALVLWISAKKRKLREDQILAVQPDFWDLDSVPDFWDLDSVLNAILKSSEFPELIMLPTSEKKNRVLEILRAFPALIVADDFDTILAAQDDLSAASAVEFLIFTIPSESPSKILLTSRVDPKAGYIISVKGFDPESHEAFAFVDSRLRLLQMQPDLLNPRQKSELLGETEGIPLYVEDFLRLFRVVGDSEFTRRDDRGESKSIVSNP
jgi:hypothetical protein